MERSAIISKELRSGLLLRDGTRVLNEDEIQAKVGKREFVGIENID